ncbi:hypothetical protein OIU76_028869 [Salix suchowensis]|nr:hypothetical protein OIU76_028869 [Salix suchowensis]
MLVLTKRDERDNMWIFLKPLSLELWLTTGIAFIFTGLVVWVLEHRENKEFRGKPGQQLGTTLWFSFSTLFFAHRHQKDSFVKDFLVKELNFNASLLKEYDTPEEYHHALSIGIRKGGVAAIFDEIPYVKLFLAKYGSKFQMVGPTYKTDGFGFAFSLKSPLVSHVSRAILKVTQDKHKMEEIERRNFGRETTCLDEASMETSGGLGLPSFGGLFIITGVCFPCLHF